MKNLILQNNYSPSLFLLVAKGILSASKGH